MPDIQIDNCGTVTIVRPTTDAGREWCEENVHSESWQHIGGGIAVEPRCVQDIIDGATDDGLTVE